jgi:hypothetical protein
MPSSFLLNLPLELRTQIYTYLFTTPKSRIELVKTSSRASGPDARYKILPPTSDGGDELVLSFLRTCKQIYAETKNLLWQHNTLHLFSVLDPPREGIISSLSPSISTNVQSVSLDIDLIFHKTLSGRLIFGHNLSTLASWVHDGRLSSITLTARSIIGSTHLTHRQLEKILSRRIHPVHSLTYREYLKELQLGTDTHSALSTINRRLVIDTTPPALSAPSFRPRPIRGNPMDMLQEVASAWGGRLEVNGVLVFQDGQAVEDVFLEQREPKQYFYKEDIDSWLLTEVIKEEVEGKCVGEFLAGLERGRRMEHCRRFETQIEELRESYGIRRIARPGVERGSDESGVTAISH